MQTSEIVKPAAPSLPKQGGAISGLKGEVASAGPDGATVLNVPLPVNPGRGYAPTLALNYYSRAGNGPFGIGWSIDPPAIRRRTKKGAPNYDDSDGVVGPDGETLVPLLSANGTATTRTARSLLGSTLESDFTVRSYRSRIENDFSRLEYWISQGNSARDFWVQYRPDGQVLLFGATAQARISDPGDTRHTAIWLTESSVSSNGEKLYWLYRAEDNIGCSAEEIAFHPTASAQRYLSAVCYGNRVAGRTLPGLIATPHITDWLFMVVLDYGERTSSLTAPGWVTPGTGDWRCRQDCFSSWEYGFEIRTRRLCRQILSYHFVGTLAGTSAQETVPQLITRLALDYHESPAVTTLVSLQQSAWEANGTRVSLPPLEFGWQEFTPPGSTAWQQRDDMQNLNAWQPYQMVDLNGEGLAGILYQDNGAWWYRPPIRQADAGPDDVSWDKPVPLATIPALSEGGMLADLDGDGYMEWMVSSAGIAGYYGRTAGRDWLNFTPVSAIPVEYHHPAMQVADIVGDGALDLILIGPRSVRLYSGTGEGWEKAQNVVQSAGITLQLPGADERVLVAFSDMAGSGQQHLVEVRDDRVRYWPNNGHGQFGAPVTMPGFSQPSVTFNPDQIYLADVDGSGTSDLIYAQSDQLLVYLNQSGNQFAAPFVVKLPDGVRYDNTCDLHLADIQGLGIASLVLTKPHPVVQHWVCHFSAAKPWLLNAMNNNMGAQQRFQYRSSAQFWLDEKQQAKTAGNAEPTSYLPFALHLLHRSEVLDEITGNHLVSTIRYSAGAWDGKEREFRGFGFVEIEDTDTQNSQGTSTEISMPSVSRNWYATGIVGVDERLPDAFWSGDSAAFAHFLPRFTTGVGDNEQSYVPDENDLFWLRRGMKGMLLRNELYGKDGSAGETTPYQVTEFRPQIRRVAPANAGSAPVIWPLVAETRTYLYERTASDPQCSQQMVLSSDQWGQPLYAVTLNYPRRKKPQASPWPGSLPDTLSASSYDDQQQQLMVSGQRTHWYAIDNMANGIWVNGLIDIIESMAYAYASSPAAGLTLEQMSLTGAPLATPVSQSFSGMYQLCYLNSNNVPTTVDPAFPPRVGYSETALLDQELATQLKGDLTDSLLKQAGYFWDSYYKCWVVHRDITTYGTAEHFWLPQTVRDSDLTGAVTLIRDAYDCAINKVVDAAGLTTLAEYDWRFLSPIKITDANNNIQQVTLDALGRVTSQRFSGSENGVATGYSNAAFTLPDTVEQLLALTAPLPVAQCTVYVPDSWQNGAGLPPHSVTLITDRYDQGEGRASQQIRQSVVFNDGFGRLLQTSVRQQEGDAWQRADDGSLLTTVVNTTTRWAVTGRTEYDNKGQVIRSYQPYFLNSWKYVKDDSARQDLFADTHYYDPTGREIRVVTAKGWLRRITYTPWFVASEDENDTLTSNNALHTQTPTVGVKDNRGHIVRDIAYHRYPGSLDVTEERITRHQFNVLGFLAQSSDPRLYDAGLANVIYRSDLNGTVLYTQSVDAGITLALQDSAGRPLLNISGITSASDRSESTTQTWQYEGNTLPGRLLSITEQLPGENARIIERFIWGGNSADEQKYNLAGQCVSHYDTAGLLQTDSFSLNGTALSMTRRLLKAADNPDTVVDWQGADASAWNDFLDGTLYTTVFNRDATDNEVTTTDAAGNMQRIAYDVAGLLKGSWLTLRNGTEQAIVKSITWSAAGEKLREEHGNGVVTTYGYEAQTQRLITLKTERPAGHPAGAKVLQDLHYQYDPVGNVLIVSDEAEEVQYWNNQKVVPVKEYAYDSLYQMISAVGREMASGGPQSSALPPFAASDSATYTNYTRLYTYDSGGNLTKIQHNAPASGNNYTTTITVSNRSNRGVLSSLTEDPTKVDALFTAGGLQTTLLAGQKLGWTPRSELLKVTPVVRTGSPDDVESYRYDADSQRILKNTSQLTSGSRRTQRVIYLPGLEMRNTATGGTTTENLQVVTVGEAGRAQVRVLHWESGKPASITNDSIRYSYDNLIGSSNLELDSNGEIITREEYYPFGGTALFTGRNQIEADYKTVRYSGKERDATGLYYYGYRYYQPWAARWLSADPLGTIDGLNLFRMVRNNPVLLADVDGLAPHKRFDYRDTAFNQHVENQGLSMKEFWSMNLIAKSYNWDINIRTGNSARVQYVGEFGHRPKPAGVYQKTNKTGELQGLVLYPNAQLAKGEADIHHINSPSASAPDELKKLSTEGFHLEQRMINGEPGGLIVDSHGNDVYGDIDIHSVLDKSGMRVDPEVWVKTINEFFEVQGLHAAANLKGVSNVMKPFGVMAHSVIQHGAHDDWTERNNEKYAGGINMGPQPGVINLTGTTSRSNKLFTTTDEYRTYLRENAGTGDSVYTEKSWAAGDMRSWRSGLRSSWANKPTRSAAVRTRARLKNLSRRGLI